MACIPSAAIILLIPKGLRIGDDFTTGIHVIALGLPMMIKRERRKEPLVIRCRDNAQTVVKQHDTGARPGLLRHRHFLLYNGSGLSFPVEHDPQDADDLAVDLSVLAHGR